MRAATALAVLTLAACGREEPGQPIEATCSGVYSVQAEAWGITRRAFLFEDGSVLVDCEVTPPAAWQERYGLAPAGSPHLWAAGSDGAIHAVCSLDFAGARWRTRDEYAFVAYVGMTSNGVVPLVCPKVNGGES